MENPCGCCFIDIDPYPGCRMSTGRDQNFSFVRLILALTLTVSFNLRWNIPTSGQAELVSHLPSENAKGGGGQSLLNGIIKTEESFHAYYPAANSNSSLICDASIPPLIHDRPRKAILVGAGDIASCANGAAAATSQLMDAVDGTVITLGDNVQGNGTDAEYADCYDPTWGRHKSRTYPVPGNHDYGTNGGLNYYNYFGASAGDPEKGYYSYDLGDWHIVALNSQIDISAGSLEEQWLRADLAAHPATCTLAYWHDPLFSSGAWSGGDEGMKALWQALYDYGVDIVLNGHDHIYERFAPQTPDGIMQPMRGIREFIVGTGGGDVNEPILPPAANSELIRNNTYGVLKLTLYAASYDWEFISIPGQDFSDSGVAACVPLISPPQMKYHDWLPIITKGS